MPAFLAIAGREGPPADAPRPGAVDRLPRQPADRARLRQPAVDADCSARASSARPAISARRASSRRIPELLDWLAVEFMDSGWDVKHMVKLIVMSKTYRQSSIAGKELRAARSGQRLAGPAGALPPRRRGGARQRPGHQRPAFSENRRPERQAVPAGRLLVVSRISRCASGPTTRARTSTVAACTPTGAGRSCSRAWPPSTPRRARNAPSSGRGPARRCKRWCCSTIPPTSRPPASSPNTSSARAGRRRRNG